MLKILNTYGFTTWKEFGLSLFPSFKYGTQEGAFAGSLLMGTTAQLIGVSPMIILVMVVTILVETITGLKASRTRGEAFESWKFSRCILKVCVWVVLLFIIHAFAREMDYYSGIVYVLAGWVFSIFHAMMMIYFCVENVTSILENLAVMDGKPKTAYIESMQDIFKTVSEAFKELIKNKKA